MRFSAPGIVDASCQVTAPEDSKARRCDDVQEVGTAVVVRQHTPRTDHLWLKVWLRDGAVVADGPIGGPPFWVDHPVLAGVVASCPLIAGLLWLGLHPGRRRPGDGPSDPDRLRVRSTPPRNVRPGQTGFLSTVDPRQVRSRHVAATLIDLAARGRLRIDAAAPAGRPCTEWVLTAQHTEATEHAPDDPNDPNNPNNRIADAPAPYETDLLARFFGDHKTVRLSSQVPPALSLAEPIGPPRYPFGRWWDRLLTALLWVLAGSIVGTFGVFCWSIWRYLSLEAMPPFVIPLVTAPMSLIGPVLWAICAHHKEHWQHERWARRLELYRRFLLQAPAEAVDTMTAHLPYAIALEIRPPWVEKVGTPDHPVAWFTGSPDDGLETSGVRAFVDDLVAAMNGGRQRTPW